MTWKVELLDVFEHSWHPIGAFATREEAIAAAKAKFARLQPPPGKPDPSGGPHPPGIQDRIFIIPRRARARAGNILANSRLHPAAAAQSRLSTTM